MHNANLQKNLTFHEVYVENVCMKDDMNNVRVIQVANYLRKQEMKKQREEELTTGLKFYK